MKLRVRWLVGTGWWSQDYASDVDAQEKVNALLLKGFWTKSKAGVVTNFPAHRISKITRRIVK